MIFAFSSWFEAPLMMYYVCVSPLDRFNERHGKLLELSSLIVLYVNHGHSSHHQKIGPSGP